MTMWNAVDAGRTLGTTGSEGGVIVRDDEHDAGARITLEEATAIAPFAITCGVYGVMVHTRYFGERVVAERAHDEMRAALVDLATDALTAEDFVARYP